jgi:CheY-like chemotaxis protein
MNNEIVLVVEDNFVNLKLITILLTKAGHTVHAAIDAEEAQKLLVTLHPTLILMDIQLPGMDGLTLTHLLKTNPATHHIPVIALTAYAMRGDDTKALQAGCDGYISKPIDTRTFLSQLTDYLAHAQEG